MPGALKRGVVKPKSNQMSVSWCSEANAVHCTGNFKRYGTTVRVGRRVPYPGERCKDAFRLSNVTALTRDHIVQRRPAYALLNQSDYAVPRESCLHKTYVIEHVIFLNGVVHRNRNSVAYGSASIMPTRDDRTVPGATPHLVTAFHNGVIGRVCGTVGTLWVTRHPPVHPSWDHHRRTPAASLRYFPNLSYPIRTTIKFFPIFYTAQFFVHTRDWPIVIQIRISNGMLVPRLGRGARFSSRFSLSLSCSLNLPQEVFKLCSKRN